MHPLSIFPELFTFELFAPVLLRLAVGLLMIWIAKEIYGKERAWFGPIYVILSLFVLAGFYTQIAAILSIITLKAHYYLERKDSGYSKERRNMFFLMIVVLLSLLVTGPGFFAFDLPL